MSTDRETKELLKTTAVGNLNAYYEGVKEGVRMYAWMKDGVTYVGTGGWLLREELKKIDDERARRLEGLLREEDVNSRLSDA